MQARRFYTRPQRVVQKRLSFSLLVLPSGARSEAEGIGMCNVAEGQPAGPERSGACSSPVRFSAIPQRSGIFLQLHGREKSQMIRSHHYAMLRHLYHDLRLNRGWNEARRRKIYRQIEKEKRRLIDEIGADREEVRLLCRHLVNPQNSHAERRMKAYRAERERSGEASPNLPVNRVPNIA